ncbi:MAG: hypothetical protein M2R45_03761 [Verrucomicrobia subdivision 3 bacterium]|nr:hypothetical protein [Limisphaerales bacterium]
MRVERATLASSPWVCWCRFFNAVVIPRTESECDAFYAQLWRKFIEFERVQAELPTLVEAGMRQQCQTEFAGTVADV